MLDIQKLGKLVAQQVNKTGTWKAADHTAVVEALKVAPGWTPEEKMDATVRLANRGQVSQELEKGDCINVAHRNGASALARAVKAELDILAAKRTQELKG